ncbi:MAG: hypothetical protein KY467_02745 [Gemmatimonadetes bacterium]|nr:hypothetical protein [Gemmatimonadota bacterium]
MIHRIRSIPARAVAAVAAVALLAGTAASAPLWAEPSSRAEAASMQTRYLYFSDATYSEWVGEATSGCGQPYRLLWGEVTAYVETGEMVCPY